MSDLSRYGVYFDDGAHTNQVGRFGSMQEARDFLQEQVRLFENNLNPYQDLVYLGEEDEEFDFELALLDSDGFFEETLLFWSPSNGYHEPA